MFDNIGKKIMALTKIVCTVGITLSVILGIVLIVGDMIGIGIAAAILLSLACWLGSFMLYAFGQLIDDTHVMRHILEKGVNASYVSPQNLQSGGESDDYFSRLGRMGSLRQSSYASAPAPEPTPAPAPSPAPTPTPAPKPANPVDDHWICECGTRNSATSRSCSICYTPRPSKKK